VLEHCDQPFQILQRPSTRNEIQHISTLATLLE